MQPQLWFVIIAATGLVVSMALSYVRILYVGEWLSAVIRRQPCTLFLSCSISLECNTHGVSDLANTMSISKAKFSAEAAAVTVLLAEPAVVLF